MTNPTLQVQRGTVLVPVMFVVMLLGGLSAFLLSSGLGDRTAVNHVETSMKALELAEAGLHRAQMEIFSLTDPDEDGIGTVSGELGGGSYDVVCQQEDPSYPDRWTATAVGEHGHSVRRLEVGIRRRSNGYFVEGLFARSHLKLNGTIATDSYDSTKGTWDSQAKFDDIGGKFANEGGHVGSNQGIDLLGTSSIVRGNAIPGPGFVVEGVGVVRGDQVPRKVTIDLPAPDRAKFEEALLNNANATLTTPDADPTKLINPKLLGYDTKTMSLTPKGDVVLLGGTYFFNDIKLTADARIVVKGPSTIYVTGSMALTGQGLVNESGVPGDLQIYASPYPIPTGVAEKNPVITVVGETTMKAAIYAPDHTIDLGGGGSVFGAMVGGEVKVHGTAYFHYDEALGILIGDSTVTLERLYWREVSESPR